jgi:site-specific DNA recombinase
MTLGYTPREGTIAASYARISAEKDDRDYSIPSQLEANRHYAQSRGFNLAHELSEVWTGKAQDRPEYAKVRDLVRKRAIGALIVYATDRFARKIGVGDFLLDELMRYGVELHIVAWNSYVRDTPEDRVRFNFEMTFSDFERRKIIERTQRGKREKVASGKILGIGAPLYGYQKVGDRDELQLIPDKEQSEVVQLIFHWFVNERLSVSQIRRKLATMSITPPGVLQDTAKEKIAQKKQRIFEHKTKRDGWGPHTIYRILRNEAYCGIYWQNKTTQVLRPQEEIDAMIGRGEKPSEYKEIKLPQSERAPVEISPIIDRATWEAAQQLLDEGRKLSKSNKIHDYLMARRIKCQCGKSRTGVAQRRPSGKIDAYYNCISPQCVGGRCDYVCERADDVDYTVWEFVKELLLDPKRLLMEHEEQKERQQTENAALYEDITHLETRIEQAQQRLRRTLDHLDDAEAKGDSDEIAHYQGRRDEIKGLLNDLREERDTLTRKVTQSVIPEDVIRSLAQMGEEYGDLLNDPTLSFEFKRGIVDDLQLTTITTIENGQKFLDFGWAGKLRRRPLLSNLQGSSRRPRRRG